MMLLFSADTPVPLPRKVYRPRFTNEYHFDLPRILQFRLDPPRDLFGHRRHAHVVHVIRQHDHAHFTPRLDGEDLLNALVARRDLLEALETLHVRLERLAARAGPRAGNGVGGLNEHRDFALVRDVVVVRGDAVHDERVLAVFGRDLHAELYLLALVFMREDLAPVVYQRATALHVDVEPQLRGHDGGEPGYFLRVLQNVL